MPEPLRATLSLTQLVFYGVGTVVGAGIYSIIGAAAGAVGPAMWLSLLLAALAALLTAFSYAELISAYPRAGAEFHFLRSAFPRWPVAAYVAGVLVALNAAASSAAVAVAFGEYLNIFVELSVPGIALLLLVLCTALNILGIRESTWVGIGLICIEVGGLLLLVGGGLLNTDVFAAATLPAPTPWPAVFSGAALVFFIYTGFEGIANLAEEAKAPRRDLPRALLASVIITSVIYLLVVWTALALLGADTLAQSEAPLERAGAALHPRIGHTLAITALFATASTALINLVSISRLLFSMARAGEFPPAMARVLPGRRTPWVAALVLFVASAALLVLEELETMASISALGLLLVFAAVQLTLIVLRYRAPGLERPFRVRGSIGRLPLLPVLGILISLALATQFSPVVYAVTGGTVAAAMLLRLFTARPGRDRDPNDHSPRSNGSPPA